MSLVKRYVIFFVALIGQSAGIALVVKSLLGTSPISSLPYVASLVSPYTLGQTTFVINMLLIVGQILLLRRRFPMVQFLQVPALLVFAMCIDAWMAAFAWVKPEFYWEQMAILLVGTSLVSFGVALQGIANVLMLPGEGIVYTITKLFHLNLARVKTANDVLLVVLAAVLSLTQLGTIEGIREGTLISALITGTIARFFLRHMSSIDAKGNLVLHLHWRTEARALRPQEQE